MRTRCVRRGYTLVELTISLASAAALTVSLGASLVVATRGLDLSTSADGRKVDAERVAREMTRDLQQATRFTEQTATSTTFLVPDRDADGDPETIRYAWSGAAPSALTYSLNGGPAVSLASDVQALNLTYSARAMTAPPAPTENLASGVKLLYVTAGVQVQPSGTGASQRAASGPTMLVNPSSLDRAKIDLFESWGYDVTFILPQEPWSNFSSLIDQSQVVFISAEADSSQLDSRVYNTTKGVVIERTIQYDNAHFAGNASSFTDNGLRVRAPSHYIMSGYTTSQFVPILSSSSTFNYFSSVGSDVANLMGPSGRSEPSLMTLSPGDQMNNGSSAVGRRVLIPWGFAGLNYANLTTDGKTIVRRCLEWGAGAGSDPNSPWQTFGYTAVNASLLNPGASKQIATRVTLPQQGKIKSISVFMSGATVGTMRVAIYSNQNDRPYQLLSQSSLGVSVAGNSQWTTMSVTETSLNAGDYWLAVSCSLSSQTLNITPGGQYATLNYDTTLLGFRSNWGTPDSMEAMSFSIYATYKPN